MSEAKTPKGLFVALGCAGALVLAFALMGAALFYFGFVQRGGVYDGLRVQMAQSQLNQLVPYIEMYRSRHGSYPDHLEEVAATIPRNVPVMIFDASSPPTGPQRSYYYERVGDDHYVLRGAGADGVAFTSDDIVPNGFAPDVTGLLLERPQTQSPAQTQP